VARTIRRLRDLAGGLPRSGPGKAAFTNSGQGDFAVVQFAASGSSENLLVNQIGNYTGSVPLDPGYLVITSDGRWTVVSP